MALLEQHLGPCGGVLGLGPASPAEDKEQVSSLMVFLGGFVALLPASRLSVEAEVGQAGARVGTERQKSGLLINLDVDCSIGQFIFAGTRRMSALGVSLA